jgi:peptidoglycan/LPS O-acetylase OafA/YrhL
LQPKSRRYPGFELLRLLAAVGVLFSHGYALVGRIADEPVWQIVPGILNAATASVGVFFAISGYLVTSSFLERADSARGVLDFVAARFLRIFPAFAACLLLTVLLGAVITTQPPAAYWSSTQTWDYLWRNLLLGRVNELPGVFSENIYGSGVNGSIWTIPLEVGMYVATLAFGLIGTWRGRWRTVLVCATLVAWCYLAPSTFVFFRNEHNHPAYAVLCYAIGATWVVWRVSNARTWPFALATLVVFIVHFVTTTDINVSRLFAFAAVALFALFIGRLQWPSLAAASRYGDLSYGIFLYSFPIQQTLVWAKPTIGLHYLLLWSLLLSLAMAWLSWHLIEKYALRLKAARRSP